MKISRLNNICFIKNRSKICSGSVVVTTNLYETDFICFKNYTSPQSRLSGNTHHITTGTPGFSDLPMALVYLIPPIPFFDQPLVVLLVSLLLSKDTTLSTGGIGLTKVSIRLS